MKHEPKFKVGHHIQRVISPNENYITWSSGIITAVENGFYHVWDDNRGHVWDDNRSYATSSILWLNTLVVDKCCVLYDSLEGVWERL